MAERGGERVAERGGERVAERVAEREAERGAQRVAERGAEREDEYLSTNIGGINMEKKTPIHIQGDVYLVGVDSVPSDAKLSELEKYTVQSGEATGHHHTLYPSDRAAKLKLYETKDSRFIDIPDGYFLRHQEHEGFLCKGLYEIRIEERYDPFEKIMKRAID